MDQATILPYITDEDFLSIVDEILSVGVKALKQADNAVNRNVIDPFLMLFEMGSFTLDHAHWLTNEKTRQAQKTLSNSIGIFHQKIIGAVHGWDDLATGKLVDVVNDERMIIAEVKNKYNTVKQSDLIGIYHGLEELVMPKMQHYKGYTAYYVEIIPKKPMRYDECFTPPDRETGKRASVNELIRKIDGASFYELVTGEKEALAMLYDAIPIAIKIVRSDIGTIDIENAKRYFTQAYEENR